MPTDGLALIGAGGHASVVADAALLAGSGNLTVLSENPAQAGQRLLNYAIELLDSATPLRNFHVAIGHNPTRLRLQQELSANGASPVVVMHPEAIVAVSSQVGVGSFIAAGTILAPRSSVGEGVIVNHRAIVDHDVQVGDFSHIAPGVILGGGVRIGRGVLIGAGATILPGVTIGDEAIIGAGAVVLADVSPRKTVVGVPARNKEKGV